MMVMGKQHHVPLRLLRPKNRSGPIIFSLRSTNRDNKGVRTQTHVMEPYEIILNEQETDQGNVEMVAKNSIVTCDGCPPMKNNSGQWKQPQEMMMTTYILNVIWRISKHGDIEEVGVSTLHQ